MIDYILKGDNEGKRFYITFYDVSGFNGNSELLKALSFSDFNMARLAKNIIEKSFSFIKITICERIIEVTEINL